MAARSNGLAEWGQYADDGIMSEEDQRLVDVTMREFAEAQLWRNTFAGQWEEIAQLIDTNSRNSFFYASYNWPGQKKTDRQIDATAMLAWTRFKAILDSLLTPRNMLWHVLESQDEEVMGDRESRLWFEKATRILFNQRYAPIANFANQNQLVYGSLGAYGTGGMFVDQAVNDWNVPIPQLRYKGIPLGELFIFENHQGRIDKVIRWFRLTPRQAIQKWGIENVPPRIAALADGKSEEPMNFLHRVAPNSDYEPWRLDRKGKPYSSTYVSIEGRKVMQKGGYTSFPYAVPRYDRSTPNEVYGRSPAMLVLPSIKTLNAQKSVHLKVGHRAGDPVLLTADDGLVDEHLRPGAIVKGGVNMDGRLLIQPLPAGNVQITEKMMEMEQALQKDAFLVSLFQILEESPQMTATEVIERVNEKGILIAPAVGGLQSDYLGPMIEREMDLLMFMRVLPPLPPLLRKKKGEYNVLYTSPLARQQRAQEVAGFQRTVQFATELIGVTQDPSPLDNFDFDTALIETARIQGVAESWFADPKLVQLKRKNRAEAQEAAQQAQAMPAQAAMMKAQAATMQQGDQAGMAPMQQPTPIGAQPK